MVQSQQLKASALLSRKKSIARHSSIYWEDTTANPGHPTGTSFFVEIWVSKRYLSVLGAFDS